MKSKLNWDDLQVLLHVGRSFTLAHAAKELSVDPSTLSRRIARLEQVTNTRLFIKTQQGYALTDRGSRLMEHASAMEDSARAAAAEALDQSEGVHGTIRIGAPDGSANFLLPKVCQDIRREHPELDIQILALPRVLNLSKGEADMAITVSPPTGGRVTVQRIADYQLHLAASKQYLDASPPIQTKADLREHPIVG
jgi:DNA-binding transcriptional LysR family regulator